MLSTTTDLTGIEQFLYQEARLIDEQSFDQWLDLFTDDCCYWVPCNNRDLDPTHTVSLIYDDKAHLTERVFRITRGVGWAQSPPSTTIHMITNVMVAEEGPEAIRVLSTQLIAEIRRGAEQFYAAQVEHRLVPAEGTWRIAFKKVGLLRVDEPIANLTFIL
jgi:benzoate/toluate 1,2-dioxygenase subunit beta